MYVLLLTAATCGPISIKTFLSEIRIKAIKLPVDKHKKIAAAK